MEHGDWVCQESELFIKTAEAFRVGCLTGDVEQQELEQELSYSGQYLSPT